MIKRALISLSDKTGIVEFAQGLQKLGIEILSTGGTAKLLRDHKISVIEVGDYTGQPEILDGRLKTLHPKIHGGILAIRSDPKHLKEMKASGIQAIDLIVVNLYPFEQTIAKERAGQALPLQEAIENIDIGGPTMIRAAAKNWQEVTVVVDPADYAVILEEMCRGAIHGAPVVSRETNFRLAKKVFILTSRYEAAITNYLTGGREGRFPDVFNYQVTKVQDLRYGENPHQKAAFYRDVGAQLIAPLHQLHGKELSFNNILDLDAALETVKEFADPACVIVKHTNPCGVATAPSPQPSPARGEGGMAQVFIAARACDPLSAFGGIISLNRKVDVETAREISKDFYECVVAPEYDPDAFKILAAKKNIRLMEINVGASGGRPGECHSPLQGRLDFKKVGGGLLVQEADFISEKIQDSKVASKRSPTPEEYQALEFAWKVCRHVKSNAIVIAASPSPQPSPARGEGVILVTLGIGCGQVSRVDATKIAIMKSTSLKNAVLASDAFFPFRDNIDEAGKAGIKAIIQPGGSLKDQESIDAANEYNMAMLFTGVRHFRH